MSDSKASLSFYMKQLSEAKKLGPKQILGGLVLSVLLMGASTFGLLYYVAVLTPFRFAFADIVKYTSYMLWGLAIATVIAAFICWLIIRKPRTITLLLKIHSFLKHGTGEYFICPDVPDQSKSTVIRRSLYGSILVAGIALTIMSFDLMGTATEMDILRFGAIVMVASVAILPITVMQLYYAPWIIKDSGLFHLDTRDRSLSNVGDDLEDLLEFVAGIDIILVWIELTINTELWVAPFVIFVVVGPLFSIMLNFTLIFTAVKDRATIAMISLLLERYRVPDMVNSPDYIRRRVLGLIDKRMLVEEIVKSEAETAPEIPIEPSSIPELLDEYGQMRAESGESGETPIKNARETLEQEETSEEEPLAATELASSNRRKTSDSEQ
ncbi:MAG: hypothetical protein K9W43_06840 [Candidatus Thorarchaeota archaeon]|nr:hypothetical protein [Candidatus Thorarchaeota archaeon]